MNTQQIASIGTNRSTPIATAGGETRSYDIFKTVEGNRQVNHRHVSNLVSSIAKKNLLKQNPIFVNEKMEIIDGQHRLHAAMALDLPIPYIVVSETGLQDVQLLNAHNKPWDLKDYLESYIVLGKRDYLELKEFVQTYEISISMSIQLLTNFNTRPHEALRVFKNGDFKITNRKKAEDFADLLFDLKEYTQSYVWHDRELISALLTFTKTNSTDKLIKNLRAGKGVITRSATTGDYLRQLEALAS